jgi:NAD/NADP transhydrogenase alpha subunit
MIPAVVPTLTKAGLEVILEAGAGVAAGYLDEEYAAKGAKLVASRAEVFAKADIVLQVLCYGSNDRTGKADVPLYRQGQALIGFLRPLGALETVQEIASRGVMAFAVELMPRTTRAQSMDALSSMGTICGYKAVLLAADKLPRIFPMLTTAAGTIMASRVFIIGCGVAGLQAIATAKRLGAIVSAYDLRPVVKEQVQSLGGRFVELPLEAKDAQDARGYATAQAEDFYKKQRELLGKVVAESDVVITAAVIPGNGGGNGAGFGDRRSRGGARRQLRTNRRGTDHRCARRHHRRHHQSCKYCSLPCQPDVCPQPGDVPGLHGQGRQAAIELGRRNRPRNAADAKRRNRERPSPRLFQTARVGGQILRRKWMPADFISSLFVFILAAFLGFELIKRVSPLLHTPLMSLTNALDAIVVVAAIIIAGQHETRLSTRLGLIAVVASFSNMVGGFLITDRMLSMFKTGKAKKP